MTPLEFVLICAWLSFMVLDKTQDLHRSEWKGYLNESSSNSSLFNSYRFMRITKKGSRKKEKNALGKIGEDSKEKDGKVS